MLFLLPQLFWPLRIILGIVKPTSIAQWQSPDFVFPPEGSRRCPAVTAHFVLRRIRSFLDHLPMFIRLSNLIMRVRPLLVMLSLGPLVIVGVIVRDRGGRRIHRVCRSVLQFSFLHLQRRCQYQRNPRCTCCADRLLLDFQHGRGAPQRGARIRRRRAHDGLHRMSLLLLHQVVIQGGVVHVIHVPVRIHGLRLLPLLLLIHHRRRKGRLSRLLVQKVVCCQAGCSGVHCLLLLLLLLFLMSRCSGRGWRGVITLRLVQLPLTLARRVGVVADVIISIFPRLGLPGSGRFAMHLKSSLCAIASTG